MEVTGKNQDECIVALHDCNGDVNKAINILLEGNSDTVSFINQYYLICSAKICFPIPYCVFSLTLFGVEGGGN